MPNFVNVCAHVHFQRIGPQILSRRIMTWNISWTIAHQAHLSMEFSRQEYWSRWLFSSAGDVPDPGIEPGLPRCRRILYHLNHQGSPPIQNIKTSINKTPNICSYSCRLVRSHFLFYGTKIICNLSISWNVTCNFGIWAPISNESDESIP